MKNAASIQQLVASSKPAVRGLFLALSVAASVKIVMNDKGVGSLASKVSYKTSPPIHHEDMHMHLFRS